MKAVLLLSFYFIFFRAMVSANFVQWIRLELIEEKKVGIEIILRVIESDILFNILNSILYT